MKARHIYNAALATFFITLAIALVCGVILEQPSRAAFAAALSCLMACIVILLDAYATGKEDDDNEPLLHALRLIEHATAPEPNDLGHHEAAYEIAASALVAAGAKGGAS